MSTESVATDSIIVSASVTAGKVLARDEKEVVDAVTEYEERRTENLDILARRISVHSAYVHAAAITVVLLEHSPGSDGKTLLQSFKRKLARAAGWWCSVFAIMCM